MLVSPSGSTICSHTNPRPADRTTWYPAPRAQCKANSPGTPTCTTRAHRDSYCPHMLYHAQQAYVHAPSRKKHLYTPSTPPTPPPPSPNLCENPHTYLQA